MPAHFTLVGTGAMNSPRYRPAGLLVRWHGRRVMLDGGDGASPEAPIEAWLVSDERAELMTNIRTRARALGIEACVDECQVDDLNISPEPVVHTSHPTFGYLVRVGEDRIVWAPEFLDFPDWAAGADLMFADAAGVGSPHSFRRRCGRPRAGAPYRISGQGLWGQAPGVRPHRPAGHPGPRCPCAVAVRGMGHRGPHLPRAVKHALVRKTGSGRAGDR
jgi:hypothetical protein